MQYLPRLADKTLTDKLSYAGAVCIRGPKWCGKTSTALQQAKSSIFMQDPDSRESNMMLAQTRPSLLLRGESPRLIDEWQDAPELWDAVRFAVDRGSEPGGYILTGSAVPGKRPAHSGTGRFSFLDMRTMSLYESGDSTGEVSLAELFSGADDVFGTSDATIEDIAHFVCRGGWPRAVTLGGKQSLRLAYDYVDAVCEEDISRVDGTARNPHTARVIMREYARLTATAASLNTVRSDLRSRGDVFSKDTVNSYLSALRMIYAIEDQEAWSPSLRSKSRVTRTPARHFTDPSIAAAALRVDADGLLYDMPTLGLLFESLCVRDMRAYASALDGEVLRYHDNTGLEADIVVELRNGRYALMEVKLGSGFVDAGAGSLKKLAGRLDSDVMGEPSFMAVIVPGGYAYRREDGIFVLPITCLKP